MIPALVLWLGTYFVWHAPAAYDFALRHPHSALHLEHATYLIAGAALWWPVIHGRENSAAKAAYLFAAFVLASPLGLLLALLPDPVYAFYEARPTVWGLSHILDQEIAGTTMAAEQAIVFFAAFAYYFTRFLTEDEAASQPPSSNARTPSTPGPSIYRGCFRGVPYPVPNWQGCPLEPEGVWPLPQSARRGRWCS